VFPGSLHLAQPCVSGQQIKLVLHVIYCSVELLTSLFFYSEDNLYLLVLTECRTKTLACNKGFVNNIFKGEIFMTRHLLVKFLLVASEKKLEPGIES
jgi:hypothetical protein